MSSVSVVVFDMDGTLADISHRVCHIINKDYDKAESLIHLDRPNASIVTLARVIALTFPIVICTGRPERQRGITEEFLHQHSIPAMDILMRKDGDSRRDVLVKEEHISILGHGNILWVFEDRDCVVEMWRGHGITCLQVQKGGY